MAHHSLRLLGSYLPLSTYASFQACSSVTRARLTLPCSSPAPALQRCEATARRASGSAAEGPKRRNAGGSDTPSSRPRSKQSKPRGPQLLEQVSQHQQRQHQSENKRQWEQRRPVQQVQGCKEQQQQSQQPKARVQKGGDGVDAAAAAAFQEQFEQALVAAKATHQQRQQLETYLDYMLETNKVMNLTAVRDRSEALVRHLADSLALLPIIEHHCTAPRSTPQQTTTNIAASMSTSATTTTTTASARDKSSNTSERTQQKSSGPHSLRASQPDALADTEARGVNGAGMQSTPMAQPLRVIDVGTGAGLPGMVLAVMRPHWQVTLLDSLRKRCDFLTRAAEVAGVQNVSVVWSRAEEGGRREELRDTFDLAVARAVAETRVLSELCLPFVRAGGLWIAAKGPDPKVSCGSGRVKGFRSVHACVAQR
uniref:Ribosomal RNA small subunit methyltransferase G n=1 Tax=Dunaliella tertiolecta TaxID=3047 RepID=A0A7S3QS54_DUNTE